DRGEAGRARAAVSAGTEAQRAPAPAGGREYRGADVDAGPDVDGGTSLRPEQRRRRSAASPALAALGRGRRRRGGGGRDAGDPARRLAELSESRHPGDRELT